MAYERFENTPFDLDHDGHINAREAAYIYQTFYDEDSETNSVSFDDDYEDYDFSSSRKKYKADIAEAVQEDKTDAHPKMKTSTCILLWTLIIAAMVFVHFELFVDAFICLFASFVVLIKGFWLKKKE